MSSFSSAAKAYNPRVGGKYLYLKHAEPDEVFKVTTKPQVLNIIRPGEFSQDAGLSYMFNTKTATFWPENLGEKFTLRVGFEVVPSPTRNKLETRLKRSYGVTGVELWWDISEKRNLSAPSFVAASQNVSALVGTRHVFGERFFIGPSFVKNAGVLMARTTHGTLQVKNIEVAIFEG